MEVGGMHGNFSSTLDNYSAGGFTDFAGSLDNLTPRIRLRGLADASQTRDYFLTNIPSDGYNVERIEVQRGANGMLYGLGSPAGVVNKVLMRANVQRNSTKVTARLGSYGSYRTTLDHNQKLLKDKLALRLASVLNHSEYQIEHAYATDRRGSGTITYKPFERTTVRAWGEVALIRSTPPQNRPPLDAFSYWWAVGKPVYNARTAVFSFTGPTPTGTGITGNPAQFLNSGRFRGNFPSIVIENPNTGDYGLSIAGQPQAAALAANRVQRNATNTGWLNGLMYSTGLATSYLQATTGGGSNPANAFWRIPQMTDPAVFDFFQNQLDGSARYRNGRWKTYNVAVEQRLGRHAGIELGFDHQDMDEIYRSMVHFNNYALNLDVTTVFADGSPNPNFGRPFMSAANNSATTNRLRDAFRATAYYDFDFKRIFREGSLLARILGRHTLTSNYTWQDLEERYYRGNEMLDMNYYNILQAANAGTTAVVATNSNGPRQVSFISYLGPNLAGTAGPQNQGIQGLQQPVNLMQSGLSRLALYHYPVPPANTTVPGTWQTRQYEVLRGEEWSNASIANFARHSYSKFKAVSAVLQDRWFEGSLISTLGWRRDWVRTATAGAVQFDPAGLMIVDESVWRLNPQLDQRRDAFNYGLVLHTPQFIRRRLPQSVELSFLFNRSDNFTPDSARHDVYGRQIDPPTGETKEYGLLLSLFDRKIDLRASHYVSSSALATNSSFVTTLNGMKSALFNSMRNLEQGLYDLDPSVGAAYVPDNVKQAFRDFFRNPAATTFFSPDVTGFWVDESGRLQGADEGPGGLASTSDTVAKGLELELTANVTSNWRITANVARQQSVKSNSANALWTLLQSWRPLFVDSPVGDLPVTAGGTNPWRNRFISDEATVRRIRALDGAITPEVRKWRYNMMTNYSFNAGRLKGWGIGGAMRWQDKAAIGYPVVMIDGAPQFDVTRPYYGPTETNVDAWVSYSRRLGNNGVRWRAQFNVRDIGKRNHLIPASTQPDGTIDAYRIGANTTWTFSNTFDF
jgi:outer membrane receptor protein involved in Fe transport